jgi:hypothetical protein
MGTGAVTLLLLVVGSLVVFLYAAPVLGGVAAALIQKHRPDSRLAHRIDVFFDPMGVHDWWVDQVDGTGLPAEKETP